MISINESQGQTFKALEVTDNSFSHGMLNVALSRYDDKCVKLPFLVVSGKAQTCLVELYVKNLAQLEEIYTVSSDATLVQLLNHHKS